MKAQTDFKAQRTIYVDKEELCKPSKKSKNSKVDLRTIQVNIGSLTIHKLGSRVVSDTKSALVPEGFEASRWFWSTLDPQRKVRYFCKTLLKKSVRSNANLEEECNLTIDHETETNYAQILKENERKLREIQAKKEVKRDVIPPFFVQKHWPSLTYADLHLTDLPEKSRQNSLRSNGSETPLMSTPNRSFCTNSSDKTLSPASGGGNSLNKAISNILKRTPSKLLDSDDLLAAFQQDFPQDLIQEILDEEQSDPDVEVIKTWFNQNKKMKVTEIATQCNLPYVRNNFEMDELYEKMHEKDEIFSDTSSIYEDFFVTDSEVGNEDSSSIDMLSFVMDQLRENKENQAVLDEEAIIQKLLQPDEPAEVIVNNNEENCLSMETSPDKAVDLCTLPNPIDEMASIPQFDGAEDEKDPEESPSKKDFSIAGLLSPPGGQPAQVQPRRPPSSDDDVVFLEGINTHFLSILGPILFKSFVKL